MICHVQEACHQHVSTYIMHVGKVGGPHRTSFLFCSLVVKVCYVQKACHQHVVIVHVICVAAWEWNLCHSLSVQSILHFYTDVHAVIVNWTTVKCASLAGHHDTAQVPEEKSLQISVEHAHLFTNSFHPADPHHLCSAQSSETTLTML